MLPKKKANVIILAGGRGTRVSALYPDIPKPMIPVEGSPFIEWVIQYFMGQNLRRFVISLGHLSPAAEEYFKQRPFDGAVITTLSEPVSLGTGGALLLAQQAIPSCDPLIVSNGDSLILVDLSCAWNMLEKPWVDGVILGVRSEDTSRYGALKIDSGGLLLAFHEKQTGRGLINAGIYFFKRRLLTHFPKKTPLSLENEVFPALLQNGAKILAWPCEAPFLDIGTPQGVREAEAFIKRNFQIGDNK